MTFADNIPEGAGSEIDYPTAFGITFTPTVTGILIGIGGVLLGIYGIFNFVQPAQIRHGNLKADVVQMRQRVDFEQQKAESFSLREAEAKLGEVRARRDAIGTLLAPPSALDVFLTDLSRVVAVNGMELDAYQPQGVVILEDQPSGSGVQCKLQQQTLPINLEGSYTQIQSLLRDLERMEPVLFVKNLSLNLKQSEGGEILVVNDKGEALPNQQPQPELQATWTLEAVTEAAASSC